MILAKAKEKAPQIFHRRFLIFLVGDASFELLTPAVLKLLTPLGPQFIHLVSCLLITQSSIEAMWA